MGGFLPLPHRDRRLAAYPAGLAFVRKGRRTYITLRAMRDRGQGVLIVRNVPLSFRGPVPEAGPRLFPTWASEVARHNILRGSVGSGRISRNDSQGGIRCRNLSRVAFCQPRFFSLLAARRSASKPCLAPVSARSVAPLSVGMRLPGPSWVARQTRSSARPIPAAAARAGHRAPSGARHSTSTRAISGRRTSVRCPFFMIGSRRSPGKTACSTRY